MKPQHSHNILSVRSEAISDLVSLEEIRTWFPGESWKQLVLLVHGEAGVESYTEPDEAFTISILKLVTTGRLTPLVVHPNGQVAHCIRAEVLRDGHPAFDLTQTIEHMIFVIKPALLRAMSLDIRLQGQEVFLRRSDAKSALHVRPTPDATVKKIIRYVLDEATAGGSRATTKQVVDEVCKRSDIHGVSTAHIKALVNEIKPTEMTKAGRPPRRKKA